MGACCAPDHALPEMSKSRDSYRMDIEEKPLLKSSEEYITEEIKGENNDETNQTIEEYELQNLSKASETLNIIEIFGHYDERLQLISERIIRNETNEWLSCLGSIKIDSRNSPNSVYTWTIKVHAHKQFSLGIVAFTGHNNGYYNTNNDSVQNNHSNNYEDNYVKEYLFGHSKYINYGWTWNDKFTLTESNIFSTDSSFEDAFRPNFNKEMATDKLIKMELDLKEKTIRYFVNNKDYGIAFEKVDTSNQLQFGISFKFGDIEIVNCEIDN